MLNTNLHRNHLAPMVSPVIAKRKLKVDKRGRVRFAAQGHRFEVNKSGLQIYRREANHYLGRPTEDNITWDFAVSRLKNPTLLLIAEAVMLVNNNA